MRLSSALFLQQTGFLKGLAGRRHRAAHMAGYAFPGSIVVPGESKVL